METVFPACLSEPAFLNALLYSIVQTLNLGRPTVEGFRLKGKAIDCLNQKLSSNDDKFMGTSVMGAIMVLKGTAVSSETTLIEPLNDF